MDNTSNILLLLGFILICFGLVYLLLKGRGKISDSDADIETGSFKLKGSSGIIVVTLGVLLIIYGCCLVPDNSPIDIDPDNREIPSPTITWNSPDSITYGTALGRDQLNALAKDPKTKKAVPGTFVYTLADGTPIASGVTVLGAGKHTLYVDFTPDEGLSYGPASEDVIINVKKSTPVISWSKPGDIIYGTALNRAQLNAVATDPETGNTVPGNFLYDPLLGTKLDAGTHTLKIYFTPDDVSNYTEASRNTTIDVINSAYVITWSSPADITYGTALGNTQLDAVATDRKTGNKVLGKPLYYPPLGTKLGAGTYTLRVDFTPDNSASYAATSQYTAINVTKSTPAIIWSSPADITYGTALGNTQLDDAVTTTDPETKKAVHGDYDYTLANGTKIVSGVTVLSAGTHTLHVDFTPEDASNYTKASKDTTINVKVPDTPTPITVQNVGISNSPAVIEYNGTLYCFHQGSNNNSQLWYSTFDGTNWAQDIKVSNVGMGASPAVINYNGKLYCFHQGYRSNGKLWYSTFDGTSWAQDKQVQNVGMSDSPAVIEYNGILYCFHQGSNNNSQLWYSTFDGTNWAQDIKVSNVGMGASPAVINYNGKLYCFHQGYRSNGKLWYSTFDGTSWAQDKQVQNVGISNSPAVINYNEKLYCFHQESNNNGELWYSTFDGTSWAQDKQVQNVGISNSPAVIEYKGKLYCFHQGSNNSGELWYSIFDRSL